MSTIQIPVPSIEKQNEIIDAINNVSVSVVNVYGCNEPTVYEQFEEAFSVSGSQLLLTYTVPSGKDFYLKSAEVSGANIAEYSVYKNASLIGKLRTYFGAELNAVFDFSSGSTYGNRFQDGDVLEIYVNNTRPTSADFDARIYGVIVSPNCVSAPNVYNQFNEALNLAGNSSADICTYTVPSGKSFYLILAEAGGENIAKFDVKVNASIISSKRSYYGGELYSTFNYGIGEFYGKKLVAGDELKISVTNNRPTSADFEGRFYGVLIAE